MHAHHPTGPTDRVLRLLRPDERIPHPDCLAKYAVVCSGGRRNKFVEFIGRRAERQRQLLSQRSASQDSRPLAGVSINAQRGDRFAEFP